MFISTILPTNLGSDVCVCGGGGGRKLKKGSKNDLLTGHFQSFFFNISRENSKTSKVNQQSVLNLYKY